MKKAACGLHSEPNRRLDFVLVCLGRMRKGSKHSTPQKMDFVSSQGPSLKKFALISKNELCCADFA